MEDSTRHAPSRREALGGGAWLGFGLALPAVAAVRAGPPWPPAGRSLVLRFAVTAPAPAPGEIRGAAPARRAG